jgi:hypothetical protein
MAADDAPMSADKGDRQAMATVRANTRHSSAAIGVPLSAAIGAFKAFRFT